MKSKFVKKLCDSFCKKHNIFNILTQKIAFDNVFMHKKEKIYKKRMYKTNVLNMFYNLFATRNTCNIAENIVP